MEINLQDPRYSLKALDVQIDGNTIDINHILDITIDFDINNPYISGAILLELTRDTLEKYNFKGNSKVQIKATDTADNEYDNSFVAYESYSKKVTAEIIHITFRILDEFSFNASHLFVSKGYENISLSEILDDDKMLKPLYDQFNSKKKDFEDISEKLKTFAIPSSKSALNVQNYIKEYFNALVYQTREKYKIQKWETLMNGECLKSGNGDLTYKYPSNVPEYIYTVDDFKINQTNSMNFANYAPDVKIYSYNPLARNAKFLSYDSKKALKDMGSDIKGENVSQGIKFAYQSMVNPKNQIKTMYQRNLYNTSSYELICKGSYKINPGDLVMLEYEGNEGNSKNISGKYLVTRVTDKIIQGAFSQRIILARPNIDDSQ